MPSAEPGATTASVGPFFTVGHSTRSLDEFRRLLDAGGVEVVADIRRLPGSAAYPQFDGRALEAALSETGVAYVHLPKLGGRRPRDRTVLEAVNGMWRNRSFHNYADYALGADFRAGLARLVALGTGHRVGVMCSEAVWWRCHRRIVADHLLAAGHAVFHLMGDGRVEAAHVTDGAHVATDCTITYPIPGSSPPEPGA